MTELFKNRPARNAVLLLLAVFILLTAIGFVVLYQNSRNMTHAFIRQDIALVGGMAENKPVSQLSILTIFSIYRSFFTVFAQPCFSLPP